MVHVVKITIPSTDFTPNGCIISVNGWQVNSAGEVYFPEESQLGEITIPEDTLLKLQDWKKGRTEAQATVQQGTCTLSFGVHHGTMMSRDFGTFDGYPDKQAAIADYHARMKSLRGFGYQCWFAYVYPHNLPDEKEQIDSPIPYL